MMVREVHAQEPGQAALRAPAPEQRVHTIRAIRAIYERNQGDIYRFVRRRVQNRQDAEDLTAEVFVRALRGLDASRDDLSIRGWLFQVARTLVVDYWRAVSHTNPRSLDDLLAVGWDVPAATSSRVMCDARIARLYVVLAHLPPHYRDVLTMRFLLNRSVKETAADMGLTVANTKVLTARALKKARRMERELVS
jgi:RNA polymerase sigma-70 factor (ECF subfamily)